MYSILELFEIENFADREALQSYAHRLENNAVNGY